MDNKIRIQKIIADSGYCSRRKAEAYIESAQVKLNGRPVKLGDKANPHKDIITINGEKINSGKKMRYIKLYKPRGYQCTNADPHAKKLITELLKSIPERLYPVGRLDVSSEGLILLTNDGEFANRITHPKNGIKKTYRVTVPHEVTEDKALLMKDGLDIGDGEITQPCVVEIVSADKERSILRITISEGKNRQIRRMCEVAGLKVSRLKRVSVGGVKLGMLKPGEHAELTEGELRLLNYGKDNKRRKI
ncbi:MAG: rRNA pseudouridine synthase [Oscillospiraceae bacterium]|nr:rRNA pseudouridine synthase [Oscillospiraceae bacterium]